MDKKTIRTQNIDTNEQNDYPNISKRATGIFGYKPMTMNTLQT